MRMLGALATLGVLLAAMAALGGHGARATPMQQVGPAALCLADRDCRAVGLLAMGELEVALAAVDGSEGDLAGDRVGQDNALPDWHLAGAYTRAAVEWLLDHLWAPPPGGYAHVLELAFDVE